jgi:hypothetical protein
MLRFNAQIRPDRERVRESRGASGMRGRQQSTGVDVTTGAVVISRRTRVGLASGRLAGLLGIVGRMRLIAPP